ncbi:uncharacterized protein LOC106362507 [Brassica napus]|uniref:uncharacterized protein LOC106344955 n=1 Tax=Brassica oleracea var. oleracea TaxID=109376 RepID=UPI0006A716F1|nr:PREDICTED: uncharacterized protein LOC106344955 [Brassica oleracea var. oleracea]XP_013657853.2 uncharacterized protein LOC106362507 [Brassica napus]
MANNQASVLVNKVKPHKDSWKVHVKVSASGGKYRPTPLSYKITFTSDTLIGRSVFEDDDPYLNFVSYEDIGGQGSDANVLIDIIGEVFNLDGIQIVQVHGKDRKRVHFRLRDTNGHDVRCCLWGKYAEQFEPFIEDNNVETLLCLIRFAKISFYQGDIQITNAFDASLVILNPTMKEAIEFREKLLQVNRPLAIMGTKSDNQVQSCKIICSIESVDTDWGWFYFGCCGCNKRVSRIRRNELAQNEKPLWYCEKCHSNVTKVEPKYKLHLNVKDDSGSCKLMMLDTITSAIVGCEAVQIWDGSYDEIEDPEVIPMPLESLVGKSFSFGISITSGNLDNGSNTFYVSEVSTGNDLPKLETQSEPVSALDTNSSTLPSGEVLMLKPNSASSSEGFTTPTVKRKEEDAELKDITSTSKKLCTKPVKLEKTKDDTK